MIVSLRARTAADLTVLKQPSWWTPQRLVSVLAALAAVVLLAGLWIAILRRQVTRQTSALRRSIEVEAALEERQRIAREFHDTLEQELIGITLRLDALATRVDDDKARTLVTASRNLVSRIQVETRDLISDLRDSTENSGDLAAALEILVARQSTESCAIRLEAPPALAPLPASIVHDLRMIAREAVTNGLKHARPSTVVIQVNLKDAHLVLRIVDNGAGFDPATATQGKRGHFGCAGIRERARKLGATVTWQTELQRGTTVEVSLPLQGIAKDSALAPRLAPASASAPSTDLPSAPAPRSS